MDNKNMEATERIRKKFLAEFEAQPELYHQIDVERVRTENWQIERFIMSTDDEDKAYKTLTEALKWKKSFGLHERNDQYFPKEFYIVFELEIYGEDREQRPVMWSSVNNFKKLSNMNVLFQQFFAHQTEKIDRKAGDKGWTLVFDASHWSLGNMDVNLYQFRSEIDKYYPLGMRLNFNIDMPHIMNSAFKFIMGFMSQKMRDSIKIIKREELTQLFDIDTIPVSLGGNRSFKFPSDGQVLPLHQLKHFDLTHNEINNFYDTYRTVFGKQVD